MFEMFVLVMATSDPDVFVGLFPIERKNSTLGSVPWAVPVITVRITIWEYMFLFVFT